MMKKGDLLKGDLKPEGINVTSGGSDAAVCEAFGKTTFSNRTSGTLFKIEGGRKSERCAAYMFLHVVRSAAFRHRL